MDLKLEADDELSRRIRRRCLVGKLIWASSVLSPETVKSLTKLQWGCKGDYTVSQIKPSLFIFSFQYEQDFKNVISNTPYTIRGVLLILSPWVSSKVPSEFQFSFCPFWVQVHNLPFNCSTKENQLQISQLLGNLICLDDAAYGDFVWKKFLRIRVNIDIRKPLLSGFWHHRLGLPDIWVEFKYEKLGNFCYKCGCIGKHHFNNCDVPQGTGSYGPWMKADEVVAANNGGVWNRGGGGGSYVSGGATIFECVGSKIFGNSVVNLVDLDEIQRAVLVPADRTMVGEEEETDGDNHDASGGGSTRRFPILQRVVKNMISAVILIVNCKIIAGRVAAANHWENINVCLLLLSMFAYLFYLVQTFVHSIRSVRSVRLSTSVAAVDPIPRNRDLLLFLLVFVILSFC